MQKLKVTSMGENVQGVRLQGNPKNPEPETFRIALPWGDVDVTRTSQNDYWVHFRVNKDDAGLFAPGIDEEGDVKAVRWETTSAAGKFDGPVPKDLYHLAVLLGPTE